MVLIDAEPNHSVNVKEAARSASCGNYVTAEQWTEIINHSMSTRLWNEGWNEDISRTVLKIKTPNILFNLSNAPRHIAEELIHKKFKSTRIGEEDEEHSIKLKKIINRYLIALNFIDRHRAGANLLKTESHDHTVQAVEYYTLLTLDLKLFMETQFDTEDIASQITTNILSAENTDLSILELNKLLDPIIVKFRHDVLNINRSIDIQLDLLLDLITKRDQSQKASQKSKNVKPGRQKKTQTK